MARTIARRRIGFARRTSPKKTGDARPLPKLQAAALTDLARKAKRLRRTLVLFSGSDRAGKRLAAQFVARAMDISLYRIDLSAVVSKYIGETEKNLRRVFDKAENSGALLFLDEADALFGKRSKVKDSHDRYANEALDYALERLESLRGLVILACDHRRALDSTLTRKIRHQLRFRRARRRLRAV